MWHVNVISLCNSSCTYELIENIYKSYYILNRATYILLNIYFGYDMGMVVYPQTVLWMSRIYMPDKIFPWIWLDCQKIDDRRDK